MFYFNLIGWCFFGYLTKNDCIYICERIGRYGTDAAKATQNGMMSAGNVGLSVNNLRNLKVVRTLAKETAREAVNGARGDDKNDATPQPMQPEQKK